MLCKSATFGNVECWVWLDLCAGAIAVNLELDYTCELPLTQLD